MQRSLDFYATTSGLRIIDKVLLKDGNIIHPSVGFESPLLMLSRAEDSRTPQSKDDLAKNKAGIGIEFCIHIDGSKMLDELSIELKAKEAIPINEQKNEIWSDNIFTLTDPDGYAISFGKRIDDVA
jgi:uncharacterized glyoxalase superfamily protein PhnB